MFSEVRAAYSFLVNKLEPNSIRLSLRNFSTFLRNWSMLMLQLSYVVSSSSMASILRL